MKTKSSHPWNLFVVRIIVVVAVCLAGCAPTESTAAHWWKGNLHTHSFWSDGKDYPEMVAHWYKQHGYQFLALSEHNSLAQGEKWIELADDKRPQPKECLTAYLEQFGQTWVEQRTREGKPQVRLKPLCEFRCLFEEPDRFLLIPAEELSQEKAHLNAINIRRPIEVQAGEAALEVLQKNADAVQTQRQETQQPMFSFVNHPNWNWMVTAEDMMPLQAVEFFEIYNGGGYDSNNYGDDKHAGMEKVWDVVLTKRLAELNLPIMYAIAVDDTHTYRQWGSRHSNPGRGWVVVHASHLTPESIVKAMGAGDFYASTGVVLDDMQFDGRTLEVVIRPQRGVSYITQFIGTLRGYDPESRPVPDANDNPMPVTRIYSDDIGVVLKEVKGPVACYTFTGREIYVRAKVTSSRLKRNPHVVGEFEVAWTQPVAPGKGTH